MTLTIKIIVRLLKNEVIIVFYLSSEEHSDEESCYFNTSRSLAKARDDKTMNSLTMEIHSVFLIYK